jgi:hypothetical protein
MREEGGGGREDKGRGVKEADGAKPGEGRRFGSLKRGEEGGREGREEGRERERAVAGR